MMQTIFARNLDVTAAFGVESTAADVVFKFALSVDGKLFTMYT